MNAAPKLNKPISLLALTAIAVLVRIPFLKSFDLVTYDGTYYINIARSIVAGSYRASVFPVGYPAFIAAFMPLVSDGVRAAQIVSFLAGAGSVLVFYLLCRQFVDNSRALLACIIFAVTPLFVRLSTTTMSESLYLFWVLAGLVSFARRKELPAGLALGMAAITRPEALGIFGALGLLKIRMPKRLLVLLAGFVIPYSINVAVQSVSSDSLVLIPKSKLFGSSASSWKLREEMLEFSSKNRLLEEIGKDERKTDTIDDYLRRLPRDLLMLARHATPIVILMALYAIFTRRIFVLAMFVPLLFFPFFTFRSEPRFVYPYIPALILHAVIALERPRTRTVRAVMTAVLCLSAASGIVINRNQLTVPVSDGYQWAKRIGRTFRDRVAPEDRIADRKPLFALYAGGEYFEIPIAPIDKTLAYLALNDAEFLVLHVKTIEMMRPQLLPMIYDPVFSRSELRYGRVYEDRDVIVCRKRLGCDPLTRAQLAHPSEELLYAPRWSTDGTMIAVRVISSSGESVIRIVSSRDGGTERIVTATGLDDPISWASDSDRIAFAKHEAGSPNIDIYLCDLEGGLERVTSHGAIDMSPSWSVDGSEIAFSSNRSGRYEIWSKHTETGALERITNGWYGRYPVISPDGRRIAYIREGEGLFILDRETGNNIRADAPRRVHFAPAWSRDGGIIAVTGSDWGKMDVYLVTADGRTTVQLTKTTRREMQPDWSPDDSSLVTVTMRDEEMQLWILTGLGPYRDRLMGLTESTAR